MRTFTCRSVVGFSILLSGCFASPAFAQKDPETTVGKSLQALSEITRNPKTGMPRLVMRKAEGFAIIPDMFKMSFIFGSLRPGRPGGQATRRHLEQSRLHPALRRKLRSASSAQSTDLILVFQSRKGLDRILKGKGKLTLGVDAGAAAGPVGKRFEASTDAQLKAEILSYSNTRGIFAGVSAEGGTLQIDGKANTLYYNQPVSPGAILAINSKLPVPPSTISLQQLLAEKTAWPEQIVKGKKPRTAPVIVGEEIPFGDDDETTVVDGAIRDEPVRAPSTRSRTAPRPQVKPQADPDDEDDIDALPPPPRRKKPQNQSRPQRPNDEDLPEALPGPAPAAAKARPKPRPEPAYQGEEEDEVPRLDPPR